MTSSAAHTQILPMIPIKSCIAFPPDVDSRSRPRSDLLLLWISLLTFTPEWTLLSLCFCLQGCVGLGCPRRRGWNRDSNAGRYLGGNTKQYDSEVGVEQGREGSWYDCDLKQITSLGSWAPYSNVVPWQTVRKGVPRLFPSGDEKVEILVLLVQGCWPLQHFQLAPWSGPAASTGKVSAEDIVGRAHWQRLLHLHWHFWSAQASFVECSSVRVGLLVFSCLNSGVLSAHRITGQRMQCVL